MAEKSDDLNNPRLSVLQFLSGLGEGNTLLEVQSALVEASKAVELTRKKGKVTLEIDLAFCSTANKAVIVLGTVKSKVPKMPPVGRVMFIDSEGGLHHHDIQQRQIDLRPRAVQMPPPAGVDPETGEIRATN